jgi:glycosyltransferase involved in cell wall biosynthesis
MLKRVIIAVSNDLCTDQRVQRVAQTLVNHKLDVVLIGRQLQNSKPVTFLLPNKRFKLWFNKGPLFYANLNIRLFFYLIFHRFDLVLSNDLDTLAACRLASIVKRKKIVYDSHEYFTEVPELVDRKWQKRFWEMIEEWFLPGITHAYTVCQSLADIYNEKYKVPFQVIRNVPVRNRKNIDNCSNEPEVIIYQGALNLGRGIELMIDAMSFLPDYKLWIAGTGDIEQQLHAKTNQLLLNDRVIFLGRLKPEELNLKTPQAAIGLSLEEDFGLNYHFALPNKLFDYIQAQIPVIVSNLPEMRSLVEKYGVGEILTERTPEKLAYQIQQVIENEQKMLVYKENLKKAANELCWEAEEKKLLSIFESVFGKA